MGESNIYNTEKELITPIGKEKDAMDGWIADLKKRYLAQKNNVFGTINKNNYLAFNLENDKTLKNIKVAERVKTISGFACRS